MLYDEYATSKKWLTSQFGSASPDERRYYEAEFSPLTHSATESVTFVEIGFGNGSLLGWAKSRGYRVLGAEIQSVLRDRAASAGYEVIASLADLAPDSVDVIAAMDVFEHIAYEDLMTLCRQVKAALKPGGYLVARFPNGDSPFSLIHQNGDPTHISAIGAGIAKELMRASGLELVELRAPTETAAGVMAKAKLQIKHLLRGLFSAYVRAAYLGGSAPVTFEINYLLIARKPA